MKTHTLELKHLAPYLPYGLNINEGGVNRMLTGIKIQKDKSLCINYDSIIYTALGKFKPLLRPHSQLTQEIEHNEKKFVPIDIIKNKWGYEDFEYQGYSQYAHWFKLEGNEPAILHLPYCFLELLFKWHFDVFGLIENNLAIEIK